MNSKIKIVSFNFRTWFGADGDEINNYVHRVGPIFEKFFVEMPDVVGFQEVTARQMIYLERILAEYQFVGQYRDADFGGEGTFIAVRKDRFQILGFNTFWLSPTPYVPGSRFEEQSTCPRICNVVRLLHKETGKIFRMFNTHLDHIGEEARVLGMKCILTEVERLNAIAPFPTVITGDMNATPESKAMTMCREFAPVHLTDVTAEFPTTFHGFGMKENIKIDYIYMSDELSSKVTAIGKWDDVTHGCYLSDHYPIWAEVDISAI